MDSVTIFATHFVKQSWVGLRLSAVCMLKLGEEFSEWNDEIFLKSELIMVHFLDQVQVAQVWASCVQLHTVLVRDKSVF